MSAQHLEHKQIFRLAATLNKFPRDKVMLFWFLPDGSLLYLLQVVSIIILTFPLTLLFLSSLLLLSTRLPPWPL